MQITNVKTCISELNTNVGREKEDRYNNYKCYKNLKIKKGMEKSITACPHY